MGNQKFKDYETAVPGEPNFSAASCGYGVWITENGALAKEHDERKIWVYLNTPLRDSTIKPGDMVDIRVVRLVVANDEAAQCDAEGPIYKSRDLYVVPRRDGYFQVVSVPENIYTTLETDDLIPEEWEIKPINRQARDDYNKHGDGYEYNRYLAEKADA